MRTLLRILSFGYFLLLGNQLFSQINLVHVLSTSSDNCTGTPIIGTYTESTPQNNKPTYVFGGSKIFWKTTSTIITTSNPSETLSDPHWAVESGGSIAYINRNDTPTPPDEQWESTFGCFAIEANGQSVTSLSGCVSTDWYLDSDGDGVGGSQSTMDCTQPSGYVASTGDCNDNDAGVQSNGSAPFVVNGVCYSTLAGAQTAAGNTGVIYLENNSTNDPTTSISQDIILVVPQGLSISFSNNVTCYGTIANVGSIGVPNLTIEQGGKYLGSGTLNGNLINNGTIDISGEIPFNEENAELLLNITKDKN